MGNSYFDFKRFRIEQGNTSMKVTTEACILGAVVNVSKARRILDIGAGTGLITLMLAQRSDAEMTAVELDHNAVLDASENINASPWKDRISLVEKSIQDFAEFVDARFDLIVSNPPFFSKNQKSGKQRDRAIHNDELGFDELGKAVSTLLQNNGKFVVLYPPYESGQFEQAAERYGLWPISRLQVFNRPDDAEPLRHITTYAFEKKEEVSSARLIIRENQVDYTQEFVELMKPYYLKL